MRACNCIHSLQYFPKNTVKILTSNCYFHLNIQYFISVPLIISTVKIKLILNPGKLFFQSHYCLEDLKSSKLVFLGRAYFQAMICPFRLHQFKTQQTISNPITTLIQRLSVFLTPCCMLFKEYQNTSCTYNVEGKFEDNILLLLKLIV